MERHQIGRVRRWTLLAGVAGVLVGANGAHAVTATGNDINAGSLRIVLDTTNAKVLSLYDTSGAGNVDHNVLAQAASLISLTVEASDTIITPTGSAAHYKPTSWSYAAGAAGVGEVARGTYTFNFADGIVVGVRLVEKSGYATFEVISVTNPNNKDIRNVLWGPLATDIADKVGDQLGVASTRDFAMGMIGANAKTTGGWPNQYRALGQHANLAESDDQWGRAARFWFEISAARTTSYGSVLQAYTRDYSKDRAYDVWDWQNFNEIVKVPALTGNSASYGTLVGSKVAVFGVSRSGAEDAMRSRRDVLADQILSRVEAVELGENIPHPIVANVWAKRSEKANAPYLILTDINSSNTGTAGQWAKDIGFESIYRNTGWGLFNGGGDLSVRSDLGGSDAALSSVISSLNTNHRIGLGSHSLSNWIGDTNSVTTSNRGGIARRATGVLAANLSSTATSVTISGLPNETVSQLLGSFSNTDGATSVLIDNEIIAYGSATQSGSNIILSGLTRGVHGSSAVAHSTGATANRLWHYSYGGDYDAGLQLALENLAPRYAAIYGLGLSEFSYDGSEALMLTHDAVGLSAFPEKVYSLLTNKDDFVQDMAVATPYNWHVNSRYNWGETADDITTAHQRYRWSNQIYFDRNYQKRAMGWWAISDGNEWRWAMGKAASFDAGFAYYGRVVDSALYSQALRSEIRDWQNARLGKAFDQANQFLMRKRDDYFKLDKVQYGRALGPTWALSDWAISGTEGGIRSNSRYIAPQLRGFPSVNVARNAKVTSSSRRDNTYHEAFVVDGHTGIGSIGNEQWWPNIVGAGEWEATGANPWVQLDWDAPQKIRQIVLFDRELTTDNITSATLSFSDGSSIAVGALPTDGKPFVVNFGEKSVSWARLTINSFSGSNPGLGEFVVMGPNVNFAAGNLATNATVTGVTVGQETRVKDGTIASASTNLATLTGTSATLDLGGQYYINGLNVWHNFSDGRTFRDVIFEIADNSQFNNSTIVYNADATNVLGKGAGSDPEYAETGAGKLVQFAPVAGRYIRLWSNGNSVDGGNTLAEVEVYGAGNGTTDATAVTSNGVGATSLVNAIDHNLNSAMADVGTGAKYLQIDLGSSKLVNSLAVMRDNANLRTYHNVIYQLSNDPTFATGVTTVFNNDHDNVHGLNLGENKDSEYQETENGRYVTFTPASARYVRLYSNGSNYDSSNRYREVLVGTNTAGTNAPPQPPVPTGTVVGPASVTQSAGDALAGYDANHLIDGSGLSGTPTPANYATITHAASQASLWVTATAGSPNYYSNAANPIPTFVFDLGGSYNLNSMVVWGYGGNSNEAARYTVEFSADGVTYANPETVQTTQTLGSASQALGFSQARTGRYVRVKMINNANGLGYSGPGGDRVGLGEVRFIGDPVSVPTNTVLTPSTVAQNAGDTLSGFDLSHLIDGSGLSATPTLANVNTVTHSATQTSLWVTATAGSPNYYSSGTNPQPRMVFDLGSSRSLASMVVWGYGGNSNEAARFTVEFSADGVTYANAETVQTSSTLGTGRQVLAFSQNRTGRYVRVTMTGNANLLGYSGPGGDRVGLGEVRFIGQ